MGKWNRMAAMAVVLGLCIASPAMTRAAELDLGPYIRKDAFTDIKLSPNGDFLAATVQQAMEIMTDGRFRHLPVMDQGKLVGLVSIGDCVKRRIAEAEQEAEALRSFVVAG